MVALEIGLSIGGLRTNGGSAGGEAVFPTVAPKLARAGDGSVGQVYTATPGTYPRGTPARTYQWVRMTKGTAPVATPIAGADQASYRAGEADVGFFLAFRELVNGAVSATVKALVPVFPAPILVDAYNSLAGRTPRADATQSMVPEFQPGIGGIRITRTPGTSTALWTDKSISGLDASKFDVMAALFSNELLNTAGHAATFIRDGLTLGVVQSAHAASPRGRRWFVGGLPDQPAGTVVPSNTAAGISRIRPSDRSTNRPSDSTSHVLVGNAGGQPRIILFGDDGYRSFWLAVKKYFDPWGMKVTMAPPSGNIKPTITANNAFYEGDIPEILAAGHHLAMDSPNDGAWTAFPDLDAAVAEMHAERARLLAFGIPMSHTEHMVWPYGFFGDNSFRETVAGTVFDGTTTVSFPSAPPDTVVVGAVVNGGTIDATQPPTLTAIAADRLSATMSKAVSAQTVPATFICGHQWTVASAVFPGDNSVTFDAYTSAAVRAGAELSGFNVPAGTTIVSVAADKLSAVLSNAVPAQTIALAVENNTGPFARRKLMDRFAAEGIQSARATVATDPTRMPTRFGFADMAMAISAGSLTGKGFEAVKAAIDQAIKYKTNVALYTHAIMPSAVVDQGLHFSEAEFAKIADYAGPLHRDGVCEFVSQKMWWEAEGKASLPF